MTKLNFSLDKTNYSWKNALLWGNFAEHCKLATKGSLGNKAVHSLIAMVEFLPIISQFASALEKIIVSNLEKTTTPNPSKKLTSKRVKTQSTSHVHHQPGTASTKAIPQPAALKAFVDPSEIRSAFNAVHSNEPVPLDKISHRQDFMQKVKQGVWKEQPVVISQSEFVPKAMTEHLMRNKKDSALGVKYQQGDKITNMEGALHTFLTPISTITMTGDYTYQGGHTILPLDQNAGRKVILSAAIQPDFESSGNSEIVMRIVEVKQEPTIGQPLPSNFQPLWSQSQGNQKAFEKELAQYDKSLQAHMVYHLTKEHRLPALSEIQANIVNYQAAIDLLEQLILDQNPDLDLTESLNGKFVELNGHVLSLEALFNVYAHQLRNEFSVLEQTLPQGYVYTIDPPAIFTTQIGGVKNVNLLNRLQILAFKHLKKSSSFSHLQVIGFNDYSDKKAIKLLTDLFSDKQVVPKQVLFKNNGHYSISDPYALVLHNNSDAFGQNIESEGPSSMDGVIGSYSDAACHLQRNRANLVQYVI